MKNNPAIPFLLLFGVLFTTSFCSAQTIWYVKISGTGNGTSWANATDELQEAIDSANAGDQIWVAAGTYYPTVEFDADQSGGSNEREKTFYINKNIKIYGRFNGTETLLSQRSDTNVVILSGDIDMIPQDPIDNFSDAYHVLFFDGTSNPIDSSCLFDGFTIRDGIGDFGGGNNSFNGSGAYLDGSSGGVCSPTISNCRFTYNFSIYGDGAHIFNNGTSGESSPRIQDCVFDVSFGRYGGGIYNMARQGISSPVIERCTFLDNGSRDGGAIYNDGFQGTTSTQILDCYFEGNFGSQTLAYFGFGGAIYHIGNTTGQPPLISNCIFYDNETSWSGGAIYVVGTIQVENCLFNANSAEAGGGAVCNVQGGLINKSIYLNCTFYENVGSFYGTGGGAIYNEGGSPRVTNCIIWNNQDEILNTLGASCQVTNSIVQGSGGSGAWVDSFGVDGGNNLDEDPLFVNTGLDSFQLTQGSPAVNSGILDSLPARLTTDLSDLPRIIDGQVDMGVFEFKTCHDDLTLDETDSPLIGSYYSSSSITVEGSFEILTMGKVILTAPNVLINSEFYVPLMQQLEIFQEGCQ